MSNSTPASIILCPGFLGLASSFDTILESRRLSDIPRYSFTYDSITNLSDSAEKCLKDNLAYFLTLPSPKHVFGYSMGGRIALMLEDLCRQYYQKNLFDFFHIFAAHPGLLTHEAKQVRAAQDNQWIQNFLNLPDQEVLKLWNAQEIFNGSPQLTKTAYCGEKAAAILSAFSLSKQKDFRGLIKDISINCCYYYGENDTKYKSIAESLQLDSPPLQLCCVPKMGHRIIV